VITQEYSLNGEFEQGEARYTFFLKGRHTIIRNGGEEDEGPRPMRVRVFEEYGPSGPIEALGITLDIRTAKMLAVMLRHDLLMGGE